MSSSLLQRLKAALAGQYDVERELGAGGMGCVFLARDVTLQRDVAVKILRPEHATAASAERFLREARIVAKLRHPNVVQVHSAGEADGLFYYVMDYVEGETLAERLERGPLAEEEVVKLGDDLLAALEAAHDSGVIHRDIKPGNVFTVEDRTLLADFGIAKPVEEEAAPLTASGAQVGTPAYMPPEQVSGDVTPRTDLYAVGMLLYEATTGQRWSILTSVDDADWSRVSSHLSRVLRGALAWSPRDRWEDAAAFRRALTGQSKPKAGVPTVLKAAAAAALVLLAAFIGWQIAAQPDGDGRPAPGLPFEGIRDLAILPFNITGDWQGGITGAQLARLVAHELEGTPDISVAPTQGSFEWWDSVSTGPSDIPEREAAADLGARYAAHANLFPAGDSMDVELSVFDERGNPVPGLSEIRRQAARPLELSKSIALTLGTVVLGDERPELRGRISEDWDAVKEFLHGDEAFTRGSIVPAVKHYRTAVEEDSTFVLAWWYLANAWRWVGESGPLQKNFKLLHDEYGADLGPVDSLLVEAQLAPAGEQRLRIYETARRLDPLDYFAAYLLGEELFNRGPLWGEPLDSAVYVLEEAGALNPRWATAYVHLVWAYIRLGRREDAQRALDHLGEIAAPREDVGWLHPLSSRQAYLERFEPQEGERARRKLIGGDDLESLGEMAVWSRFAASLDVPETQLTLGRALVTHSTGLRHFRANGHVAQGLAFTALGRTDSALVHFDSMAALLGSPQARLQAAQWRVLPRALGLPAADTSQLQTGRRMLEAMIGEEAVSARAAWTLAIHAYANGDTVSASRWRERLEAVAEGETVHLLEFLRAMEDAARGRYQSALSRSEPLLAFQARTTPLSGGPRVGFLGDPFARAALHLQRGEWFKLAGDLEGADREWLWYEATDIDGFPSGAPQAGEIDWALGTYARYERGIAALDRDDAEAACRHLSRVLEFWSNADSGYTGLVERAAQGSEEACR